PKLLDVAQSFIAKKQAKFALSGSSARKLKRGAANLLAGRAYTYFLHPLSAEELSEYFSLDKYLAYGGLPHVWNVGSDAERVKYLRSYVSTYLKEEISEGQIVRNLEPFAKFLQIAAQSSGQIINYLKISRDVGVSDQTVKTYFQILEDTLIGFLLPAFSRSVRKSQGKMPKFYLFDTGVLRALRRSVDQPLTESNYQYGNLFEHFVISQIRKKAEYSGKDYQYSFLRLDHDKEIDLIIDRPGRPLAVVEIKSTSEIKRDHTDLIQRLIPDLGDVEAFLLSRDKTPRVFGRLKCLNWQQGIEEIVR
ncbi:MAG: DUF4143 domain-containing protein, partial [Bdellovibrionales bacterium]|nr:DUF4143 domain-containing protein [Bdellovibrionales bacterium]